MEALAEFWASVTVWWAELPPLPDLGLPEVGDPDLLLVIATVLLALGLTALVSAWADRRRSWIALLTTLGAAALIFWVWESDRDEFGWVTIPEAFVEMIARMLN